MKKVLLILLLASVSVIAQKDGLSYQAVIIDPVVQEIPGVDITGNVLQNTTIDIRFTIVNNNEGTDYQEIHTTTTDAFGMINLIIGQGIPSIGVFNEIFWDGTKKDLKVEVNLDGNFKDQDGLPLLFIPYAFHRDIISTGFLTVDGQVNFANNLIVEGTTNLNDVLSVNNESPTRLTGSLFVDGQTTLNDSLVVTNQKRTFLKGNLTVDKETKLNDSLRVSGPTSLQGTLIVEDTTRLNNSLLVTSGSPTELSGTLDVDGETNFNGNVTINNGSPLHVSGNFNIEGTTLLEQDLTVQGTTYLNNSLSVNNVSPTLFTGQLKGEGEAHFQQTLDVSEETNFDNKLNVNGQNDTNLSGSLTVGLTSNLNNSLSVNNDGSTTNLSGNLTVGGATVLNNNLSVEGVTNLNNALNVNNQTPTLLTRTLSVDGETTLNGILDVVEATTLNNELTIANGSATHLSGTLDTDGATILKNTMDVLNGSATTLSGTLNTDGITTLKNTLDVTNGSTTELSGVLNVTEATVLSNTLEVTNGSATGLSGILEVYENTDLNGTLRVNNGSPTRLNGVLEVDLESNLKNNLDVINGSPSAFTGSLNVDGETNLNNTVGVNGATLIDNTLTVTGATTLNDLSTADLNVGSSNDNFIVTFENQNDTSGDGIVIKLGRNHGAWNPGAPNTTNGYLNLPNPIADELQDPLNTVGGWLDGGTFTPGQIFNLVPQNVITASVGAISNKIFEKINSSLGLPIELPAIKINGFTVLDEIVFFGGTGQVCTVQYCYNPCTFFNCTICIPPINFCLPSIPRIAFPEVYFPTINVSSAVSNFLPALPTNISTNGLTDISIPNFTFSTVPNSLSSANEYMTFQDKDGRQTGVIRAQSTADFRNNTVLDNVYVLNIVSSFVGVDLLDGITAGVTSITNLIEDFNQIGVEYSSGNGDYSEWLERENNNEYLTAGDIVSVKGGKITKNLDGMEQIMVVSHKPIVLGNMPKKEFEHLGNTVAFMGQVPVKVIGIVKQGDYIVADTKISGYGKAINPLQMTAQDYTYAVGRAWENYNSTGPKMVNTVIGVYNGDWANEVSKIEKQQEKLDKTIETLEQKLNRVSKKLNNVSQKETIYASKE
jgi:hypothetical protein